MRRHLQTFLFGGCSIFSFLTAFPAFAQGPSTSPPPGSSLQQGDRRIDPVTGVEYQRQVRTVETPVVKSQLESKVVTISRPELVTETVPVTNNYWTPVVRYEWQPYWRGLWNPFTPATLEYRYVPQTRWEPRSETYQQVRTATRWVSEQKVVQEPRLVTSIEKKQVEDWVAVSRPQGSYPQQDSQRFATPQPTPTRTAGLPPTILDPYSTRPSYGSWSNGGTIFR
jgi:hypothetical protein